MSGCIQQLPSMHVPELIENKYAIYNHNEIERPIQSILIRKNYYQETPTKNRNERSRRKTINTIRATNKLLSTYATPLPQMTRTQYQQTKKDHNNVLQYRQQTEIDHNNILQYRQQTKIDHSIISLIIIILHSDTYVISHRQR